MILFDSYKAFLGYFCNMNVIILKQFIQLSFT